MRRHSRLALNSTRSHEDEKSLDACPTVAIVGASYAGLVLARTLQHLSPRFRTCVIEECDRESHIEQEFGEVNLRGKETRIFATMGLEDSLAGLTRQPDRVSSLRRRELLACLTESLQPGTVCYGRYLSAIAPISHGGFHLTLENLEVGEFSAPEKRVVDHVVLAYGLSPLTSSLVTAKIADRVGLIGDARLPFELAPVAVGWTRIRHGAYLAMADGLAVARLLSEYSLSNDGGPGGGAVRYEVYSAARWQKDRRVRRTAVACMVVFYCSTLFQTAFLGIRSFPRCSWSVDIAHRTLSRVALGLLRFAPRRRYGLSRIATKRGFEVKNGDMKP
mmetsp:Transcript_59703/g.135095  ORF Transcript_59703/g.135095 Transcript_59703/m.135095 type:complete len:333 (-) Transcript_59703:334-1332(-)